MNLNILICEDEPKYLSQTKEQLERYCKSINQEYTLFTYNNDEIPEKILNSIDIACLDIDICGQHAGIEIARKVNESNKWAAIIFITNFKQYEDEAFRLHAYGYLEKPLNKLEMEILLDRAFTCINKRKKVNGLLSLTADYEKVEIPQDSIIYIEKVKRKVKLVTFQQYYNINMTLTSLSKMLNKNFLRIERGIICSSQAKL